VVERKVIRQGMEGKGASYQQRKQEHRRQVLRGRREPEGGRGDPGGGRGRGAAHKERGTLWGRVPGTACARTRPGIRSNNVYLTGTSCEGVDPSVDPLLNLDDHLL